MTNHFSAAPFNSPLETGVRSLAILVQAYPDALDLQRLVELDYLVVHSGDAGGPESLHAPLPLRASELLVRRGLIEKGLLLMMSRKLVLRYPRNDGFEYVAGEAAAPFMTSLGTPYIRRLVERASWAVSRFRDMPTEDIRKFLHSLFEKWTSQFQTMQSPGDVQ